ncbi:hypothetical protein I6F21_29765 [Bradyrhizobium sp. NBAIM03]|uniref:hypothetical protein n=1 Tax=Bradyrhizobium sp. NBAIM03 TaxID=2793816 RepID=UPI001CD7050C|nr:hypothetical protein [Bradyrhizobium sp. NBAIM03]MCA1536717.1 hypothetical protein [Bradyrhizobium sp. NBAIM03]
MIGKSSTAWDHPPTRWWRLLPPSGFHPDAIRAMRHVASCVEFFGEPRWRAAVAGDAESAISIALSMNPRGQFRQKFDVAMTVLAACACEGSAAACVIVGNVILNLPKAGDKESDLADAWAPCYCHAPSLRAGPYVNANSSAISSSTSRRHPASRRCSA